MQLRLLRDPPGTRYRFRAYAASAIAHLALLVVLLSARAGSPGKPWFRVLTESPDSLVNITMVFVPPGASVDQAPEATEPPDGEPAGENVRGGAAPDADAGPAIIVTFPEVPIVAPRIVPPPAARVDSTAAAPGVSEGEGEGEGDRFVPPTSPGVRFGDGTLWREPFYVEGFLELLEQIEGDVDLAERMQAIFDSVQAEPGAIQRLPEWALALPGIGPVGLTDKWIQIGPIKVPAAVLALLPFPQANFEEAIRRRDLAEQRRDLLMAAQRAATVETFKEEVRKIRERMQRERDLRKAGRRDTTAVVRP